MFRCLELGRLHCGCDAIQSLILCLEIFSSCNLCTRESELNDRVSWSTTQHRVVWWLQGAEARRSIVLSVTVQWAERPSQLKHDADRVVGDWNQRSGWMTLFMWDDLHLYPPTVSWQLPTSLTVAAGTACQSFSVIWHSMPVIYIPRQYRDNCLPVFQFQLALDASHLYPTTVSWQLPTSLPVAAATACQSSSGSWYFMPVIKWQLALHASHQVTAGTAYQSSSGSWHCMPVIKWQLALRASHQVAAGTACQSSSGSWHCMPVMQWQFQSSSGSWQCMTVIQWQCQSSSGSSHCMPVIKWQLALHDSQHSGSWHCMTLIQWYLVLHGSHPMAAGVTRGILDISLLQTSFRCSRQAYLMLFPCVEHFMCPNPTYTVLLPLRSIARPALYFACKRLHLFVCSIFFICLEQLLFILNCERKTHGYFFILRCWYKCFIYSFCKFVSVFLANSLLIGLPVVNRICIVYIAFLVMFFGVISSGGNNATITILPSLNC